MRVELSPGCGTGSSAAPHCPLLATTGTFVKFVQSSLCGCHGQWFTLFSQPLNYETAAEPGNRGSVHPPWPLECATEKQGGGHASVRAEVPVDPPHWWMVSGSEASCPANLTGKSHWQETPVNSSNHESLGLYLSAQLKWPNSFRNEEHEVI